MTLILAIRATDGVVFGSDSQVTGGLIRYPGRKIYELNNRAVWGASGEVAFIQRVEEKLTGFTRRDQPLSAIRDDVAGFIKAAVEELLRLDFRTDFFTRNPRELLNLHPGDFLFAEHRDNPRVLHISSHGTPEWIDVGFAVTGNGEDFAHALLAKYAGIALTCEQAKLVAYKVIEEAISVVSYGLGPPIDIWQVSRDGCKKVTEEELVALEDAAHVLRETEIGLLPPGAAQEAPAPTPPAP